MYIYIYIYIYIYRYHTLYVHPVHMYVHHVWMDTMRMPRQECTPTNFIGESPVQNLQFRVVLLLVVNMATLTTPKNPKTTASRE